MSKKQYIFDFFIRECLRRIVLLLLFFSIFIFLQRGRCLAIIFGANHQVLHLMTGSKYERDLWLKGLRFAQHIDQYMDQKEQTDKYPLLYQDQNSWLID